MGYNDNSRYDDGDYPRGVRKSFIGGALIIAFVLIAIIVGFFMFTTKVKPGYAGVVYNQDGGIEHNALGQGRHILMPWKHVIEYPVSTEVAYYTHDAHEGRKTDDSITIGTKDGKTMKVDAQITYHFEKDGLTQIFNDFKGADSESIEYGYMRQNFQRIANDISSRYSMMDIAGEKKSEFNDKLLIATRDFLAEKHIAVEQAGLGKVEPDEATKAAIQAVANAQYAQKQAEYEKNAAVAQAEKQKAIATGNADAMKIDADAKAYSNQKLQQSISKELIEYEYAKAFHDNIKGMPNTLILGSGANGMMLNIAGAK